MLISLNLRAVTYCGVADAVGSDSSHYPAVPETIECAIETEFDVLRLVDDDRLCPLSTEV